LIVVDAEVVRLACQTVGRTDLTVHAVSAAGEAVWHDGTVNVLDLHNVDIDRFKPGVIDAMCGQAAFEYIIKAADLAMAGETAAVVTGPIHKEAIHLAGVPDPGHAEILARHTKAAEYGAMLVDGPLRVVHVSTHVSLKKAIELVTKERVLRIIRLTNRSLGLLGFEHPHLAVAGLNPHSGEGGLFGEEEITEIIPAVAAARAEGIVVDGPIPGDTVFVKGRGGLYDAVIAMYHDQGHIPIKDGAFSFSPGHGGVAGINVTIGLPIIRTSVDHGTAFDIAWQGKADPGSLIAALKLAVEFTTGRKAEGTA
jgi:4-hydroxythreonine-4-phosphate dehydrogenase